MVVLRSEITVANPTDHLKLGCSPAHESSVTPVATTTPTATSQQGAQGKLVAKRVVGAVASLAAISVTSAMASDSPLAGLLIGR